MPQNDVILPLDPDLQIICLPNPNALNAEQSALAESLWNSESARRPLHNGKIFNATQITPKRIEGHFIDYKTYLAAWHYPDSLPRVRTLAVSGMVIAENQVLIGQRSDSVTNSPGFYEFVPSGGIDDSSLVQKNQIDPSLQLASEFCEETGLDRAAIAQTEFVFINHEPNRELYDLCAVIQLRQCLPTHPPKSEYTQQFWLPLSEMPAFLLTHQNKIMNTTHAFWHFWSGRQIASR